MFPENFLWGASTSSHQVEGDNIHNDWWQWELDGKTKEPSGKATCHFRTFKQDFKTAKDLGHNAHRFSVEWSRIEPKEGSFDSQALDHYREVVASLKGLGIEPIVTLNHFTLPEWLSKKEGWLNPKSGEYFRRFTEETVRHIGKDVHYWITINEPMVLAYYGYLAGIWPPGTKSFLQAVRVVNSMIKAHRKAYRLIHSMYKDNDWHTPFVGIAKNVRPFKPCPQSNNFMCKLGVALRHYAFNQYVLDRISGMSDFIGVNYYECEFVSNDKAGGFAPLGGNCNLAHRHGGHYNQMGWMISPQGLYESLLWLKRYGKVLLITENGTAEDDDSFRETFIRDHCRECEKALREGVPLAGYLYWSLLDNFEWHHGYAPRFGLLRVDYQTQQRKVRHSGDTFKSIIEKKTARQ